MNAETMGEYLVKLSADVDRNSFATAVMALDTIVDKLKNIKGFAAGAAIVSGFVAISKATLDIVKSVAAADMEFQKLASRMWITKDSAKALSTAMKVMGASEEDIAWVPELREQFFRLRNEMNQFATPKDADEQLRWVRQIGYDVEALQVRLKMLKEWIAYYLIKYLGPFLKEFQDWVRWVSDKLGNNMPAIAKKIAEILAHIVSLGLTAVKAIKALVGGLYNFIESLPDNVKKWGAIFATVGAFILAGPFGRLIMVLGGALMLLEDFMYYMNGWNSSKTLAPMWEKLLRFIEGDTLSSIANEIKEFLLWVSDWFDYAVANFVKGLDWSGMEESLLDGLGELKDGVDELFESLCDVFDKITESTGEKEKARQKSFWTTFGNLVTDVVEELGRMAGRLGKIFKIIARGLKGDWDGVVAILKDSDMYRALSGTYKENAKEMFNRFTQAGMTRDGALGMIGNLDEESALDPNRVQGDVDPNYIKKVNEYEFVHDGLGFGIAQWTTPDRKQALWDFWLADEKGRALNDLSLQIDFLLYEMRNGYSHVFDKLSKTNDVEEASTYVLKEYERPEDMGAREQLERITAARKAGEVVGNSFAGGGGSSWGFNPSSWAASAAGGLSPAAAYASPATRSFSMGDVVVNVTQPNATASEIGDTVRRVMDARFGRGDFI